MAEHSFDSIIVGSGAGGAACAYRLTRAGQRVLVLEKGPRLVRDASTLDPQRVVGEGQFKSRETWRDGRGREVVPEEYFNLGGKTKWYGAALVRFGDRELEAEPELGAPAFPLDAAELASYYAEAERLLGVRVFERERDLARITQGLEPHGWRARPLSMGLNSAIVGHADEATHFDGFASPRGLKADAEVALLDRICAAPNLTIATSTPVRALIAAAQDPERVVGVRTADGRVYRAERVVLAAGALHSPRLLAQFMDTQGLAASPVRAHVGRHLKLHLLTAMVAIGTRRVQDRLRKTTLWLHDEFPLSSVQPLGFDADLIARLIPAAVPRALAQPLAARAYGFFLQTEDASHAHNRVAAAADGTPLIDYEASRSPRSLAEHRRLTRRLRLDLARQGYLCVSQRIGVTGTAHACGTLRAGRDPERAVVGADGRVHGLRGLYVVDGSVLARSSRVNPSLTIFAWSLAVASGILALGRRAA